MMFITKPSVLKQGLNNLQKILSNVIKEAAGLFSYSNTYIQVFNYLFSIFNFVQKIYE